MRTRVSLFGRPALLMVALFALLIASPGSAKERGVVNVEIGKAKMLELKSPPDVVVLGNPLVADIVVEGNGALFLLGREPGETNLTILDEEGKVLLNTAVVVGPVKKRRVTVDRGPQSFTLSCNPRCSPVATPQGTGATTAVAAQGAGGEAPAEGAGGGQAQGGQAAPAGGAPNNAVLANALSGLMGNQPSSQ